MTAVLEPPIWALDPDDEELPTFPDDDLDLVFVEAALDRLLASTGTGRTAPESIDRIRRIKTQLNRLDAALHDTAHDFARTHVAARLDTPGAQAAETLDPDKLERSVAAQIALACRTSVHQGRTRMRVARDLHNGFDHLHALFLAGELDADKIAAIVTAADTLTPDQRAELDRRLAEHDLTRLGIGRLRDLARRLVAEIAPADFAQRCEAAKNTRRVTVRPAADGMAFLTAHLPVEQAVGCVAALDKAHRDLSASPEPLPRTRGQVMADTLVERLTGKTHATDIDLHVQVIVPVEALIDPDSPLPAEIPGYGPVPADLLATNKGRTTLRRLITRKGVVIGGDTRQRRFTRFLDELIRARTRNRCTEAYCDAPIRHIDHITRAADHGTTTLDQGRGTCEFHNYLREQPGWTVEHTPDGVQTTTPTGHTYPNAPPG
ncbi:DUF222 domain-containing protein [Pseudonocardia nematodicida]|uniref:DUF222 domain-containing protein n=2 Tax=Pseudonocardia nematodicida TaxID=1206997 RepID=A0ABV1K6R4_9PSEU